MPPKSQPYTIDKKIYKDPKIVDTIEHLLKQYVKLEDFSKRSSYYSSMRRNVSEYADIFQDVLISDINSSFVTTLFPSVMPGIRMKLFRVIVELLKTGAINDEKLRRILVFEKYFTDNPKISLDNFEHLMNDKYYLPYIKLIQTGEEPCGKLFFYECQPNIHDKQIRELTIEYIEQQKTNAVYAVSTREANMYATVRLAEALFSEGDLSDFSKTVLSKVIAARTTSGKVCYSFSCVFSYIKYLADSGIQGSPVWIYNYAPFEDYFTSGGNISVSFHELLMANDLEQYVISSQVLRTQKDFGKSNLYLYHLDLKVGTELFELMKKFLVQCPYHSNHFRNIIENFGKSCGRNVSAVKDLSLQTLKSSAIYIKTNQLNINTYALIFGFYTFASTETGINIFESDELQMKLLNKPGLARHMADGYEVCRHNPSDPVPKYDKWILAYDKKYDAGTNHTTAEAILMDFTQIHNKYFRNWCKQYMWKHDKSILAKRTMNAAFVMFFNYIDDLRTGKELSFSCKPGRPNDAELSIGEIVAYRQYLDRTKPNVITNNTNVYNVRALLQFVNDYNVAKISKGVFYHLQHRNELNNTSRPIPDDDLNKLATVILENCDKGLIYKLYFTIFCICLETEFRISQIVALTADCVRETAKKGEYIIVSRVKDASTELEEQPITLETKRRIDKVLELTKELRNTAPDEIKNTLFITTNLGVVAARAISRENMRIYMHTCCKQAGISSYTAENLRDTHMTKAQAMKITEKMSNVELSVLTGHKTPMVLSEHYDGTSIETMLEAVHGVIIGNISISGEVISDNSVEAKTLATPANEVSHECGYCKADSCYNLSYIECLLCHNFVTMPSKLPYFKEQLKEIDDRLQKATLSHDIEDLNNIKRLLLKYVENIKLIQEKELTHAD